MIFLYILLGIIAVIIILAIIAPKTYDVSRSIVINKARPQVYDYLRYVKNQDHWSPWKNKDPNMKQSYEGTDGEIGFVAKWEGNKEVGMGEQELKHLVENERIVTALRFLKPWKSQSDGYFNLKEIDSGTTEVSWGFAGKNPIPFNIMMLFWNFEKAVGKDFDEGLSELKRVLEN
ncbi:MAG: SRPBCC family protein [Flavobacteriaceae bacterium]|nr:SRPBCC family protein [Flavobacteriaceae bacterium]